MKNQLLNLLRPFFCAICCCGLILSSPALSLFADEEQQKPQTAPDQLLLKKKPAEKPKSKQEPKNKLKLPEPKLDLPELDEKSQAKPGNQLPVEPIIKEMKRASELIAQQQTGKETQQIQQQVVKDLEELIRLVESRPGKTIQRMSSPSQSDSPKQSQQRQQQKQQSQDKQQQGEQLTQGPAKKSTDRQDQGKATPGQLADRNAYVKDAWGHLPPAMRQQLLNIYTEKFLPRYEDQVKRYYEALAEKNRTTP
jgi:hypothetical protein